MPLINALMVSTLVLLLVSLTSLASVKYGYKILTAIYIALTVTSSLQTNKIVIFGPFTVPIGIIGVSAAFLITDLLGELWGKKEAGETVTLGFLCLGVVALLQYIAVSFEVHPDYARAGAMYDELFAFQPRICLASFVAFGISQYLDVYLFHSIKKITGSRYLWIRNNVSTITSQSVDTLLFVQIAFIDLQFADRMFITSGMIAAKILIAMVDTPFIYLMNYLLRKKRI